MNARYIFWKKFFSGFLTTTILLNSFLPSLVLVYAEGETPVDSSVPVVEQTSVEPSPDNTAQATTDSNNTTNNDNDATLNNNVNADANTGNNVVSVSPVPSPTDAATTSDEGYVFPSPTPEEANVSESPLPTVEPLPTVDPLPSELPESGDLGLPDASPLITNESGSEETTDTDSAILLDINNTGDVGAVNSGTPDNSQNTSNANNSSSTSVNNTNDANVENKLDANADTGNNDLNLGKVLTTGDATAEINGSNVINTNITGNDFLYALINLIAASEADLDLTQMNMSLINPELVKVMAQNQATGEGSINVALANLISAFAVYNQNSANLTNDINATANTGDNTAQGNRETINTGTASASVNFFNMVNTNLTGSDWFFAIINLFKSLNGDIILPYELDILTSQMGGNSATAINSNPGDGSVNQAVAGASDTTTVNNDNDATVNNNISVSADSGNNSITGTGKINSGDADASANLSNLINTNITGSGWLLVIIQNLGNWQGVIEGWWGNLLTVGNLTFAWVQLPQGTDGQNALAVNSNTGDGSQNQSIANSSQSTMINNDNDATVTNNINVSANTGDNSLTGKKGTINTGDANAEANVANVVNTNIFGNHWYFTLITIFDNFIGNIIFPRPDLVLVKSADRSSARPGDHVSYAISYANQGRIGANNISIVDNLPAGTSFVSASDNASVNGSQVVWNLNQVGTNQTGSVSITLRIEATGGTIVNNAAISTSTDEPNKSNNGGTATVNVSSDQSSNNNSSGNSNNNDNNTGGTNSNSNNNVCNNQAPQSAPRLISAIPGENSVTLTWEAAADPVTDYAIGYGRSSGFWEYGNPVIGNQNTRSYTVKNLSGGRNTYFFAVRAQNGCATGQYSNELAVMPYGGDVSGLAYGFTAGFSGETTVQPEASPSPTPPLEVLGESTTRETPACNWWWILSGLSLIFTAGIYALWGADKPKKWWLFPIAMAATAYFGDQYVAHQYFAASQYCRYMWLASGLSAAVPSIIYKIISIS